MSYALGVRDLRLARLFLGLAFVGVLAGTVAFLVADRPPARETWVYQLATTAGYGLAGLACWRWIVGNRKVDGDRQLVRGPSRWMAAASLVVAAGFAAVTHWTYRVHTAVIHLGGGSDPHYGLRLTGNAVGTLGFVLAAAGFWIASSVRPAEPESGPDAVSAPDEGSALDRIP